MANLLDRFNKEVVGSKGKIADYLSKISAKGDFLRTTNLDVILSSWNNILLTPKRSYVWDPEYGSDLYKMVFEPADTGTSENIKDEVINSIQTYDDRAEITGVDVTFLSNLKGFNITINVDYQGEQSELSLTMDEVMFSNFMESSGQ